MTSWMLRLAQRCILTLKRRLQAGKVKNKKTKTSAGKDGAAKAPRAKSAYLFFQADKRPALKGPRCLCHIVPKSGSCLACNQSQPSPPAHGPCQTSHDCHGRSKLPKLRLGIALPMCS